MTAFALKFAKYQLNPFGIDFSTKIVVLKNKYLTKMLQCVDQSFIFTTKMLI